MEGKQQCPTGRQLLATMPWTPVSEGFLLICADFLDRPELWEPEISRPATLDECIGDYPSIESCSELGLGESVRVAEDQSEPEEYIWKQR